VNPLETPLIAQPMLQSAPQRLERRLGMRTALALLVGEVIGVGIFLTPAAMAKSLGSPLLILCVWVFIAGTALCGALCLAELGSRYPEAGGPYVYLREAFGPLPAFLYGWKCMLVLDAALTATYAAGMVENLAVLVALGPVAKKAVAVAAVLLVAGISLTRVTMAATFVRLLTWAKILLLALFVVLGFAAASGSWSHFVPLAARREGSDPLLPALASGLVAAFFCFGGWWDTTKIAGEMRDPVKMLPRALCLGIGLVAGIYAAVSAALICLIPIEAMQPDVAFAAQAGGALLGQGGARFIAALVSLFALGSLAAIMMLFPRVYYAMARDGVFLQAAGRLNPRTGTPTRAVAVQATLASIMLLVGTLAEIVAYFIFITVAFLGITVTGLYVVRRRGGASSFATPGYPWTWGIFLASVVIVLALLAAGSPRQAALGTIVVLAGIPVYYLRRRFA